MNRKILWGLGLVGVGAAAAYFGRRWYVESRTDATSRGSLADESGNYDIDGVSFDSERSEVVVSGDATHGHDPKRVDLLH